jgi:hypothetical protein
MTSHVGSTTAPPRWRPMSRFAFRLAFAYALIFIFVPSSVWRALVPPLAASLGIEPKPNDALAEVDLGNPG